MRFKLPVLALLLMLGCTEFPGSSDPEQLGNESCTFSDEILPPDPFQTETVGTIESGNHYFHLGSIRASTLYALGSKNAGGYCDVHISENGGKDWIDRSPDVRLAPISLFFIDENRAILSVRDNTGCPNDCKNLCRAVITTDGGISWTERTYPGLRGVLNHIQSDSQGNLYAHLWSSSDSSFLVNSVDQGESFEVIFSSAKYGSQNIIFSHEIIDDLIFAAGSNPGEILVIDSDGTLLKKMVSGSEGNVVGFRKLSEETFLMATTNGTWLSSDQGNSWSVIREGWSKILYAGMENDQKPEILLSVITGYCPTDVVRGKDVLAYSADGGTTWTDSELVENMTMGFSRHPVVDDQNAINIFFQDRLLKFTK